MRMVVLVVVALSVLSLHPVPAAAQVGPFCLTDEDCDDGVYCNGQERCVGHESARKATLLNPARRARPGRCRHAIFSACYRPGGPPSICDERTETCIRIITCAENPDKDGDGHRAIECGGDDCDDTDANRYPGNHEVCDARNHDEDCDLTTVGDKDADADGFVDAACCNADASGVLLHCGTDCDDSNPSINPIAPEVCNGADDNCNGYVDEGVSVSLYPDVDRDGYGAAGAVPVQGCAGRPGFSTLDNDCDDTNAAIVPGAMVCTLAGGVQICTSDGSYKGSSCGQRVCYPQPNGTGICAP